MIHRRFRDQTQFEPRRKEGRRLNSEESGLRGGKRDGGLTRGCKQKTWVSGFSPDLPVARPSRPGLAQACLVFESRREGTDRGTRSLREAIRSTTKGTKEKGKGAAGPTFGPSCQDSFFLQDSGFRLQDFALWFNPHLIPRMAALPARADARRLRAEALGPSDCCQEIAFRAPGQGGGQGTVPGSE